MDIKDLELTLKLLYEIESSRVLSEDEINLKDRYNAMIEFDKIQETYNEGRKAFNDKMNSLTKKAGE